MELIPVGSELERKFITSSPNTTSSISNATTSLILPQLPESTHQIVPAALVYIQPQPLSGVGSHQLQLATLAVTPIVSDDRGETVPPSSISGGGGGGIHYDSVGVVPTSGATTSIAKAPPSQLVSNHQNESLGADPNLTDKVLAMIRPAAIPAISSQTVIRTGRNGSGAPSAVIVDVDAISVESDDEAEATTTTTPTTTTSTTDCNDNTDRRNEPKMPELMLMIAANNNNNESNNDPPATACNSSSTRTVCAPKTMDSLAFVPITSANSCGAMRQHNINVSELKAEPSLSSSITECVNSSASVPDETGTPPNQNCATNNNMNNNNNINNVPSTQCKAPQTRTKLAPRRKHLKKLSILKKRHRQVLKKSTRDPSPPIDVLRRPNTTDVDPIVALHNEHQRREGRRKSNCTYRRDYHEIVDDANGVKPPSMMTCENGGGAVATDALTELTELRDILFDTVNDIRTMLKWEEGFGTLPDTNLKFIINEFNMVEYVTDEEHVQMLKERHNLLAKAKELAVSIKHGKTDVAVVKEEDDDIEMCCLECGQCDAPSAFLTPQFCSAACQVANTESNRIVLDDEEIVSKPIAAPIADRRRKRMRLTVQQPPPPPGVPIKEEESIGCGGGVGVGDDDETVPTSNESSQDKSLQNPWASGKKCFSWRKYLDHIKAKAAPAKLFDEPFPYNRNGFRVGMKLEGIDPQHPAYICVVSVAEVCGYRIRLHFDGFSDSYDFWLNADSIDIFPIGWCEKHNHVLRPPAGYNTVDDFNWVHYLKVTKSIAAPKHLFANRTGNSVCPNGFRIGMKLEAVDKKNKSLVCVATIKDIIDNRILVRFDSWGDIYDYWAMPNSPYIHPVGWCDLYGHRLTSPNDYPTPETFSWSKFLRETNSVAAPHRAFKVRNPRGFKCGMRLECVDRRVPQLIRVATVDDVKDHQLRISFDGWPDKYSYWLDDDSEDIHPAGWCQKTGHPLEMPLTPSDIYEFLECPTVGCRGIGHIQGAKYAFHSDKKSCPYADEYIDLEASKLPDRVLLEAKCVEIAVPVSRVPFTKDAIKVKGKVGRPSKLSRCCTGSTTSSKSEPSSSDTAQSSTKVNSINDVLVDTMKGGTARKRKRRVKIEYQLPADANAAPEVDDEIISLPSSSTMLSPKKQLRSKSNSEVTTPATSPILQRIDDGLSIATLEEQMWSRHSRFLHEYIGTVSRDPRTWPLKKVSKFVISIPGCENVGSKFESSEIDGESLLLLSLIDLIDLLGMKVGPAIKLYNVIVLLRKQLERLQAKQ